MAKELVHLHNRVLVTINEKINTDELGEVTVVGFAQPHRLNGSGKVIVILPDGRTVDLHPGAVKATWVQN